MDDCKSDPSSSQPKSGLTNQLFHRFEQLATLTQNKHLLINPTQEGECSFWGK